MKEDLPGVTVQPGQLYLARRPTVVQTILGSCVAVTFWSRRLQAGALCHGVLPQCPSGITAAEGPRYVDFSIRFLAGQFDALGAGRQEVEIKIFGGADVLPVARTAVPTVGALNCRTALKVLEEEGLRVLASDLRGTRGRSLYFHTGTGEVFVQKLAESSPLAVRPAEGAPARI